jgi:5'-nucleotidase
MPAMRARRLMICRPALVIFLMASGAVAGGGCSPGAALPPFDLGLPVDTTVTADGPAGNDPAPPDAGGGPDGADLGPPDGGPGAPVHVQLIGINDFHGALRTPMGTPTLGGAVYLATHVAQLRAAQPASLFVAAGDLVGASPLLSALFHDEPTVLAMNQMGLDLSSVGNHEFDEGTGELMRLQNGGCHPVDGCRPGNSFPGADFHYLAANVINVDSGATLFPPYEVRQAGGPGGPRIAFIGMTLEDTGLIVNPAGITGYRFDNEVDTVNRLTSDVMATGAATVVVLIHQGGAQAGVSGTYRDCDQIEGPIVDIAQNLDPSVSVVISGHTHRAYNCVIAGKVVTSAEANGRYLTVVDLAFDAASGQVTAQADNLPVSQDVDPDAAMASLVAQYDAIAGPLENRVIGTITSTLFNTPGASGESTMGAVIADSMLEATRDASTGGAQVALTNEGGVRAPLLYPASPGETSDGQVTYGEAFNVLPFSNNLVTMTLTGAQLHDVIEQQGDSIMDVSQGLSYTWNSQAAIGSRVDPATLTVDGTVVDPAGSYRVTVNSYMAVGGDGLTIFTEGTDRLTGVIDIDALAAYFMARSPVSPPAPRLTRQ